ncbi:MAG TPA: M14 family zinc carboxypeptidase [Mycobacteriales bacterium]|nr:M14 family zinc carboxypeptidase [Mycobacteriales bacterium]
MTASRSLSPSRRTVLQAGGLAGAALLTGTASAAARSVLSGTGAPGSGVPADAPRTGFEQRSGASWTTHAEELDFLAAVAARSSRVTLTVLGQSLEGRPLHLVRLSLPGRRDARPTALVLGSQHGNEPAGRETALAWLRDLALTTDPLLVRQLEEQDLLFVPSANPDGRARNSRGNAAGVDLNRDHLTLTQPESRMVGEVIRDLAPALALDLHEYGPTVPVLYDDDVLYLWPRNLNVDASVRDLSRTLCEEYIAKGARASGFTADEYGLYKLGPQEVTQTAGDENEQICRNAVGLRHVLGVLVESAVTQSPVRPGEVLSTAQNQSRRVASQRQVLADTLRFLREQGETAHFVSSTAPARKAREGAERSAPVYFGGADNQPPTAAQVLFPPPSGYALPGAPSKDLQELFVRHGITTRVDAAGRTVVPMGQAAEPVVPLLLDGRAPRPVLAAEPLD